MDFLLKRCETILRDMYKDEEIYRHKIEWLEEWYPKAKLEEKYGQGWRKNISLAINHYKAEGFLDAVLQFYDNKINRIPMTARLQQIELSKEILKKIEPDIVRAINEYFLQIGENLHMRT